MPKTIILLRGINVGGKNILPMKELTPILETLKLKNVRTYIQSGNVVAESREKPAASLAGKISAAIEASHDFNPAVLVLSADQLERAIEANPFPKAAKEPKSLHLFFLAEPAKNADLDSLKEAKTSSEKFELADGVFYLHAPDGIASSKLAAKVEKLLGVAATARNWRTVQKLAEMVAQP